jgi:hypothetical protein
MKDATSSYAAGVQRWFARRRFFTVLLWSATGLAAIFVWRIYSVTKGVQPGGKAHFGSFFLKAFVGDVITMGLSLWLRAFCDAQIKRNWDHAMVTNLGNNLGGDLSRRTRESIAAIVISFNKK